MEAPEITRRLAGFEIDAAITYLEESMTPTMRTLELYREKYVLLVSLDHPLATREEVKWGDAATLDLCTMTQRMHNRQILDSAAARDGVTLRPTVETDDAGAMYAHVVGRKMSSIVSQAWLHSFKVPAGMCARTLATPAPEAIGVVALEQRPPSTITSALWHSLADIDIAAELDSVASALVTG